MFSFKVKSAFRLELISTLHFEFKTDNDEKNIYVSDPIVGHRNSQIMIYLHGIHDIFFLINKDIYLVLLGRYIILYI